MIKDLRHYKRIFIIGNADNTAPIENHIKEDDFIVRFNKPNESCPLKADCLFVANGAVVIARRTHIFNQMLKENCHVIWRYTLKDIFFAKYEKISLDRRLRALLFFSSFKKINHLTQCAESYLDEDIQQTCTDLVGNDIPSSGFLAIYLFKQQYPHIPIYIHNFTFEGWSGHNWSKEETIVNEWIQHQQIFPASCIIQTQGN